MANDIKATPTLRGRDAVNFYKKLLENKSKKIDPQVIIDIRNSAKMLNSIFKTK